MVLPNTNAEGRSLWTLGMCLNRSCPWADIHGFLQIQQPSPAFLSQMGHESLLRLETQPWVLSPCSHKLPSLVWLHLWNRAQSSAPYKPHPTDPLLLSVSDRIPMLSPASPGHPASSLKPCHPSFLTKHFGGCYGLTVCILPAPFSPHPPAKTHMLKLNTQCDDIRKWGPLRHDKVVRVEPSWMGLSS